MSLAPGIGSKLAKKLSRFGSLRSVPAPPLRSPAVKLMASVIEMMGSICPGMAEAMPSTSMIGLSWNVSFHTTSPGGSGTSAPRRGLARDHVDRAAGVVMDVHGDLGPGGHVD